MASVVKAVKADGSYQVGKVPTGESARTLSVRFSADARDNGNTANSEPREKIMAAISLEARADRNQNGDRSDKVTNNICDNPPMVNSLPTRFANFTLTDSRVYL